MENLWIAASAAYLVNTLGIIQYAALDRRRLKRLTAGFLLYHAMDRRDQIATKSGQ